MTIIKFLATTDSALISFVINSTPDNYKVITSATTEAYSSTDKNTIGGKSKSIIGVLSNFKIFTPSTIALSDRILFSIH